MGTYRVNNTKLIGGVIMDVLLQKFFEKERWEQALETGVDKHIDKGELRKLDRKSTRLNSSHQIISYAVSCLKKKNKLRIGSLVTVRIYVALAAVPFARVA